MRTIYAEYNINHDSIDVYTSAGYMLRIDCWEAEKNLKTTYVPSGSVKGSDTHDFRLPCCAGSMTKQHGTAAISNLYVDGGTLLCMG